VTTERFIVNDTRQSRQSGARLMRRNDSAHLGSIGRRPVNQRLPLRVALIVVLAAAYTALVIHYSMRRGRLIVFPTYDDVSYMTDGLKRLQAFYTGGAKAVYDLYRHVPPHAPYSTIVAFFSFAIFGVHDWAPYAGNVLLVLGYFGFADYLLRGLPLWQKLAVFALLASFPLLTWSVQEFRPDHAAALLLVMGLIMILKQPWITSSWRHQIMAGVWCGLSIAGKPQTFASVGLLLGMTLVLATLCDRIGYRLRASPRQIAQSWARCVLPAILIPLPHFLVAWHDVWAYIEMNVFGAYKDVWQTKGTLTFHLLYYLTGPGGQSAFGGTINPTNWPPHRIPSHLILLAIILGAAVIRIFWRRRRSEMIQAACFAILIFAAYAISTGLKNKSYFFGLGFQTLLVLVAVLALRGLLLGERLKARPFPVAAVAFLFLTCAGVAAWGWPPKNGDFGADWVRNRKEIAYGIYNDIRDNPDYSDPVVFIPAPGEINRDLISYLAMKEGRSIEPYEPPDLSADPTYSLAQFNKVQFVIIADQGSGLIADFLPQYTIQDKLIKILQSRRDYAQVGRYVFHKTGLGYYLFEHIGAFYCWRPTSGMGFLEGPYPQNVLPTYVRWGYGPSSTISMNDQSGGHFNLSLSARNIFPNQLITIKLDGQVVREVPMAASQEFKSFEISFDASPGPHTIEMDYSKWEQVMPRPTAVLFSSIVIRAAR